MRRSILRPALLTTVLGLGTALSGGSCECLPSEEAPEDGTGGMCSIGAEGCPCTDSGECDGALICNANLDICVVEMCPVGTETCACTPEGVCDPGLQCVSGLCMDDSSGSSTTGDATSTGSASSDSTGTAGRTEGTAGTTQSTAL